MNKVIITGNLSKNYEVRQLSNGKMVGSNSIAVRRPFKNKEGNYDVDFINLVIFEPTINYLSTYTQKGDMIEVVGRWQHRTYQGTDGQTHYVDECVVDEASILRTKERTQNNAQATQEHSTSVYDDSAYDLPF